MPKSISLPNGFYAYGGHCGIKDFAYDLGLIYCPDAVASAAVFTTCTVKAAPVTLCQGKTSRLKAILVNSGNANACTGKQGMTDAKAMQHATADMLGLSPSQVLISSTGKIGETLPMPAINSGITTAGAKLATSAKAFANFAKAIMTTDLVPKTASRTLTLGKKTITLVGSSKGSGMIEPNMATMLGYICTDANLDAPTLKRCLKTAVSESFNRITVDGHMSTNDTCAIISSGTSPKLSARDITAFEQALTDICLELAQKIVRDGEGATKFVTVEVSKTKTEKEALAIARAIANSPLIKCAFNGEDPNWGRIISAAGYTSKSYNPDTSSLAINGVEVFKRGVPQESNMTKAAKAMKKTDIHIALQCGHGKHTGTIYTCDLSKGYVTINADYHT